ncbi:MAG: carbohydrate binding domain-containing protein [Prevotella sp.]|nr:carbohydrate binding domain-containing protein [Prevotella sp.]
MKKIFTLLALLTCFMGARAAEWVEVYKIDYSQNTGFPFYVMGYVPEWYDGVMTDFGSDYRYETQENLDGDGDSKWKEGESSAGSTTTANGVEYQKVTGAGPYWHQYFIADGIPTEIDGTYKVVAMVKASEPCTINVNMGWGWASGQQASASVAIGTDWQEVEWEYNGIGGASCNLVAQPGTVAATIEWKSVTVYHWKKETRPVQWLEWLTSDGQPVLVDGNPIPTYMGDAETPWSDPNAKFNDQEKNYLICAWGKEKGRNMNENDGWDPFPADIEEVDGSHVFVVHGQAATTEGDASAWDNQFWIQSPKAWKSGDQVKIHFRYKASKEVTVATQCHNQNPSDYLIWHAIGDVTFKEEWQDFNGTMTIADDMAGTWSIAFQLNQNDKDAINFYFDDLSWQSMKLDEGYFVAGANPSAGLEYDFDNAVQFVWDAEAAEIPCYVATIGSKNEYVSQVMISTVRGNDAAFKSATLKPTREITDDREDWIDYTESSLAKLNLPGEGIWKIYLTDEYKAMAFEMLEGRELKPVEIKPNPTLVKINALEREYTTSEAESLGIEAPANPGQPWDNQFWIVSNRPLKAGENTTVQFKYKSAIPARVSTQSHSTPGNYLHWAAIGDVNFTEEWQDFENTFTVAGEADGMQSIAFNLSEIKDANIYELKDFVWKTDDNEALINETGSENFYVKVLGGNPEVYSDPEGISTVVSTNTVPTATFNLAGQRVSKDYKGIVVRNGKKLVNK